LGRSITLQNRGKKNLSQTRRSPLDGEKCRGRLQGRPSKDNEFVCRSRIFTRSLRGTSGRQGGEAVGEEEVVGTKSKCSSAVAKCHEKGI